MLFLVWADGIEAFPRQSCRRRPSRERRRAEAEKSRIFRCQRNPHVLDQRGKGWFLYFKSCQILLNFFFVHSQLVEYKQQIRLEEKRKRVLDQHLNFIVNETEKYSSLLTEGLTKVSKEVN